MSELQPELTLDESEIEVPSTLPVLPLKETVVFPQSMTPLAIGQERSIKLVDDVVGGERMLAKELPNAAYARPALVEMPRQSELVRRETFAPILYVLRYRELDEAIAVAFGERLAETHERRASNVVHAAFGR